MPCDVSPVAMFFYVKVWVLMFWELKEQKYLKETLYEATTTILSKHDQLNDLCWEAGFQKRDTNKRRGWTESQNNSNIFHFYKFFKSKCQIWEWADQEELKCFQAAAAATEPHFLQVNSRRPHCWRWKLWGDFFWMKIRRWHFLDKH